VTPTLIAVLVLVIGSSFSYGQQVCGSPVHTSEATDLLGAHVGYGRGCVICHPPHSDPATKNVKEEDRMAMWGQDLTPVYTPTPTFRDDRQENYMVTLPAQGTVTNEHDANASVLFCLSCHDGNLATLGMLKGKAVEILPVVGGNAPTLLGGDFIWSSQMYENHHPVGATAIVTCGGARDWDCTGGNTTAISMNGPASTQFAKVHYFFAVGDNFGTWGSVVTVVTCTTCHNQHSETIHMDRCGPLKTMFFLRGYYNPVTGSNSSAQFCRQCHGDKSNEMNGQLNVPTT
jgi:hypothetical protein